MLVLESPQDVADWVAAQSGNIAPSVDAAIGFSHEGDLLAGVYFDGMSENNIFAHIASHANNLPRSLLMATAGYVYQQLGLERMTFMVPSDNFPTLRLVERMGADKEATLTRACGDADLNLYVLWRDAPFARLVLDMLEKAR